ncbi:MAG: homoserine dehydrogenase [Ruminococcaceae bacterium]|nr:homoserine dehydrogenase [Oscillospiraceae bacterium]
MKVAILGYGTVGSGVYEVIMNNRNSSEEAKRMEVKHILDLRDFPELPHSHLFTKDYQEIVNDPEVSVVAEVMGGLHPAYEYTKQALEAGKHVVTSNKELVATHGAELLQLAREKNINYMFEASVGGGIPIIRPLTSCLAANDIYEILGILNGTTNYILTQMISEGDSFEDALKKAQENGYAERNPDADILGYDACRKIAILASLACHKNVDCDLIHTQGITEITLEDVEFASRMGYVIKLLGCFKKLEDGIIVRVSPMMIPKDHPLAGVESVFNGIFVKGGAVGDLMFYGRGAGKLPTASAVVADMIDSARNIDRNKPLIWNKTEENFILDYKEDILAYYVRVKGNEAAKNAIVSLFGTVEIISKDETAAFMTCVGKDGDLTDAIAKLAGEGVEVLSAIRVLKED